MTSEIEDLLSSAGDPVLAEWFSSAVSIERFTRSGDGDGKFDGIVMSERAEHATDSGGDFVANRMSIYVASADITKPLFTDRYKVGNVEWVVGGTGPLVGGRWRIDLVRSGVREVVHEDYRE